MKKPQPAVHSKTRVATLGRDAARSFGFVNPPVVRGSTVLYATAEDLWANRSEYDYGRQGTPTMDALTDALNALEGAAGTVATPSGLGAITLALLAVVKVGDHVLVTDSAYRPTRRFCDQVLKRMGVETTYYPPTAGESIEGLIRPNTRVLFLESPGSQTFEMQDNALLLEIAKRHSLVTMMDNTWATPLYYRPVERGIDFSIAACTKYVVGHSDAMLGSVAAGKEWWPALKRTFVNLGNAAGTEELFLGLRGLRTMAVRLEQHMKSGIEIARWLEERPEVKRVLHPALASDPGHAIWKRDYEGACGLFGMVLHEPHGEKVNAFLNALENFGLGFSWGGYESLIIPCKPSAYRTAEPWTEEGALLRLHVGLEDVEDLKDDLARAFEALAQA